MLSLAKCRLPYGIQHFEDTSALTPILRLGYLLRTRVTLFCLFPLLDRSLAGSLRTAPKHGIQLVQKGPTQNLLRPHLLGKMSFPFSSLATVHHPPAGGNVFKLFKVPTVGPLCHSVHSDSLARPVQPFHMLPSYPPLSEKCPEITTTIFKLSVRQTAFSLSGHWHFQIFCAIIQHR